MKEYIKHKITIAIYKNRMRKIIFLMLLFPLMYSCSNNEETEQLKKENEKLKKEFSFKDSTIKKIIRSFNQIIDNLHAITETEKAIAFSFMNDSRNSRLFRVSCLLSLTPSLRNSRSVSSVIRQPARTMGPMTGPLPASSIPKIRLSIKRKKEISF